MKLVLDVETSIFNKGHPFDPRNFLVSYAHKLGGTTTNFCYYSDPGFHSGIIRALVLSDELVGFNIKFDLHWLNRVSCDNYHSHRIWDCSLAEYIISGQTSRFISLNEALESYGQPRKPDLVADYWARGISTENIPLPILEEYNRYDVDGTSILQTLQQSLMEPAQIALVYLMGEDLKALQHAEYSGIKFDDVKAREKLDDLGDRLVTISNDLRVYLPSLPGEVSFNWDSGDQLSAFLYGGEITYDYPIPTAAVYQSGPRMGEAYVKNRWTSVKVQFERKFKPLENSEVAKTKDRLPGETHFYQTDDPTLKQLISKTILQKSIIDTLRRRSELIKVKEMIESIQNKMVEMNWQDNYIHGQFNQNIVITGRLSSSGPNLQNTPVEVDELLVSRYT